MLADTIIPVDFSPICECGGVIHLEKNPYVHQKVELPEIKPYVTEYHLNHGRCGDCGKRKTASLPPGVSSEVFGPRIQSIVSSLTGFYKNSKREVVSILKDIFNLHLSVGSISHLENKVAIRCQSIYEKIEHQVAQDPLVHMDETSHFHQEKRGWCWLFSSDQSTFLKITESRGQKILKDSVFKNDQQLIISDRYAAYNYFKNRQVCWAHLRRDFERFSHSSDPDIKKMGIVLKNIAFKLFDLKRSLKDAEKDVEKENKMKVSQIMHRLKACHRYTRYYLKKIIQEKEIYSMRSVKIAKNLIKIDHMIWKFLDDPLSIPLTNNHAERQIRHYVVYRKKSYFTQSEKGKKFLERMISLFLTAKQQNKNPFEGLLETIMNRHSSHLKFENIF